ncbi:RNA-directed DNA polymerase [Delftia acidovorans SPH-1]|uniref:RNA-directed DNA polymerase n=2 Tax=Delftia acidovorans TaxID=80866 RepID=A9BPD9_DELAS|nr:MULTISPECIES: reverse transcriptase family protein [Delftia]MCP4019342.1 RNA-directed DNA polymerase [Delftia sp.]ABX32806.1 RNA-directed DNA polymerase [Delftia acidovorans SPH-1]MBN9321884.1 retron St85 family RNA-directed DNA polymerase [Delftia acidovorans]MCP4517682.1 RNA-directed DNA polymerase [Delftia sp.]MCP4530905.1 RNA-directed DNA polymerase [Delftia sp.]
MSQPQPTRAEIYERIKASSKQEVILDEMQRLGFWPKGEGQPQLAAAHIQREGELQRELAELRQQIAVRQNPERALRQMRKERMQKALAQREETKRRQAQERHDKALAWHAKRATHVGYLGPGVSAALQGPQAGEAPPAAGERRQADPQRLARHGLPELADAAQLADAMGINVAELRFLGFHREVARTHHYHSFTLPKKTGGERLISAPMPRLKRAQYWVLDNILAKVPAHDAAHGFLAGRSIVSNAAPHAGHDVVINLDVKDFFPSIAFGRIKGVFRHLGYGEAIATLLALLCSENRAQAWQVDGEKLFVGGKARERVLPQGAPTSPMLTNLLCRRLDRRLLGLARQLGFVYTRYADDLTFSASGEAARDNVGRLLGRVRWILRDEGFTPHPDKERVMRKGRRQEVTGLVVNADKPGVSRETRRRLRAALHRATQASAGKPAHWQGQAAQPSQLLGLAQFVYQVDPVQGGPLLGQARQLTRSPIDRANDALLQASRQDRAAARAQPPASAQFRRLAASGQAPALASGKTWWQPAEPAAPVVEKTDQQRREQRLQEREAARAQAAAAARPAVDTQQQQPAQAPGPDAQAPGPSPMPGLLTYWAQIVICFLLGTVFQARLITLIGIVLVLLLRYRRIRRWDVFAAAMVVAVLLGLGLRLS